MKTVKMQVNKIILFSLQFVEASGHDAMYKGYFTTSRAGRSGLNPIIIIKLYKLQ